MLVLILMLVLLSVTTFSAFYNYALPSSLSLLVYSSGSLPLCPFICKVTRMLKLVFLLMSTVTPPPTCICRLTRFNSVPRLAVVKGGHTVAIFNFVVRTFLQFKQKSA